MGLKIIGRLLVRIARIGALSAALAGLIWFAVFNNLPMRELSQIAADRFDARPVSHILFVGNSRIFFNDMPYMIRAMADSADSPIKYRIRMRAYPGANFADHWNKPEVRTDITERWDAVIFQAESGAQTNSDTRARFFEYGRRLVEASEEGGSTTFLLVGWNYDAEIFKDFWPGRANDYQRRIQTDNLRLARETGAGIINVGRVWVDLEALPFPLTSDGNHPTLQGSYAAALISYAQITRADIGTVTYVPQGMTAEETAAIRDLTRSSMRLNP